MTNSHFDNRQYDGSGILIDLKDARLLSGMRQMKTKIPTLTVGKVTHRQRR